MIYLSLKIDSEFPEGSITTVTTPAGPAARGMSLTQGSGQMGGWTIE